MNRKHKAYLKLNVMSLFFIAISSISVTLAWFAYSGLSKVTTEIDVKSWLIEFEKDNKTVSNDIVISLADVYPGMGTIHESIKIKNRGDSNAKLSYSITSVRIFDEDINVDVLEQDFIKDKLSHGYPFSINMDLSDNFVLAKGDESEFELSISWPLDSDNDELDSEWGNKAYQFGVDEQNKFSNDSTYKIRPSIKIVISAKAEQLTESEQSSDINYPLGKLVLYDVKNNVRCNQLDDSEFCIRTHVIDVNNKVSDEKVTLLPDLFETYANGSYNNYDQLLTETTNGWNVETKKLEIDDILKIISKDINESLVIRENLSNSIMGYLHYDNRIDTLINNTVLYNGYYSFLNEKYGYLVTNKCYWLNKEYEKGCSCVNSNLETKSGTCNTSGECSCEEGWSVANTCTNKAFALTKIDDSISKIYGEDRNSNCSVVPKILVPKSILEAE